MNNGNQSSPVTNKTDDSNHSIAPNYDPDNGPRSFTPSDLIFGPPQTLEELRGELDEKLQ